MSDPFDLRAFKGPDPKPAKTRGGTGKKNGHAALAPGGSKRSATKNAGRAGSAERRSR